ncbi:MAG: hypothetical protein WBC65_14460, partial [Ignavibacteria bacterium]
MKSKSLQTIATLILILTSYESVKSQMPEDYPFKTYLDTADNLYVTGHSGGFDIETTKFPAASTDFEWSKSYPNPGFDRGMDLALDAEQNVYVSGFLQSQNGYTDLCLLRHNKAQGTISLVKVLNFPKEDKFYGIAREGDNFYAAGFKTSRNLKDFFLVKFDRFGDTIWTRTFNNSD